MNFSELALNLLRAWKPLAYVLMGLGCTGLLWILIRRNTVEKASPVALLRPGLAPWLQWILHHRRTPKFMRFSLAMLLLGGGLLFLREQVPILEWCFERPRLLVAIHAGVAFLALLLYVFWDTDPSYLKNGDGRADARFRDIPEEWGPQDPTNRRSGYTPPSAQLLVHRAPTRLAMRLIGDDQRFAGFLTVVDLRWDILSRHLFLLGPQGSGKTSGFYGHLMLSSRHPWIYQDSKSEIPYRDLFPGLPVWGLDVRGHQTRSAVWNPMQEIESSEDFDLLVDYLLPVNPSDANPWVREMSRTLFRAILGSRPWASVQEIGRVFRATRIEPFLEHLDPLWRDLLSEPKSQVPVLQDLAAMFDHWESPRVSQITEGESTVRLADFIATGGYVLNNESSAALRTPVQVFWGMLQSKLRQRAEGSSKLLLLLDEFGDAGRIPNIENSLVLLRSKGVAIIAGIQNLGLLQQVYPTNWQAVLQGFGAKVWLARNMEDTMRETLTRAIGKVIRRMPPASKGGKETESPEELMPLDAWATWSEQGVALGRLHGFTYWIPVSIPIPAAPLGPSVEPRDPWEEAKAKRIVSPQSVAEPLHLPALPPPPSGNLDFTTKTPGEAPSGDPEGLDWL